MTSRIRLLSLAASKCAILDLAASDINTNTRTVIVEIKQGQFSNVMKFPRSYKPVLGGKGRSNSSLSINNYFLLTGILSNWTGIFNKKPTGTGILAKSWVGNGIATPPSGPSWIFVDMHDTSQLGSCNFFSCDTMINLLH